MITPALLHAVRRLAGWHRASRGLPKVNGNYLTQLDDGWFSVSMFIKGGAFCTSGKVVWWRKLRGPIPAKGEWDGAAHQHIGTTQ